MLNINKKLLKKGFSLIELMIAAAILAMAIFGIFHAYSVGFMGMADARDRTVATNYAREAMEDIKNKDFDQIITQSRNYIDGTKYEREVIVQPSTNLKKVITNVYWKDRNGNEKIVETDMAVHFIETTAGIATRIMLIANPYNVLTINDGETSTNEKESIITAVVKDTKGNTVTTYNNNITFTLNDTNSSFLINNSDIPVGKVYSVNAEQGIAIVTFQASDTEGDVTIEASDSGLTPDSVTIKVTNPGKPVKINLTASQIFMTPESISIITATVVNAGGATVESATNEITFSVSDPDLGTLSNQSLLILGVATIDLNSSAIQGTITITVSSSGLEPGVVDVITGGQISLSAFPSPVHNEEKSAITVTTKDVDGVPINYIGTINLSVTSYDGTIGFGNLSYEFVNFNGDTYLQGVTFTASSEGKVMITAIDEIGILDPAEIILIINPILIPHHINVSADPSSIEAGGTVMSTITARVKTEDNITVTSYIEPLLFTTNNSTFSESETYEISLSIDEEGRAIVELYPSDTAGTATIIVSSGTLLPGSVEVGFYIDADHIELVADPQNILAGGQTSVITATIVDEYSVLVSKYVGAVTFTIIEGYPSGVKFTSTNQSSITINAVGGVATITLQSKNWVGTAKIKAIASDVIPYLEKDLNIPVGINLELLEDSVGYNFDSGNSIGTVSFNIDVQGAELLLEEMQVSWDVGNPAEDLDKIDIAEITIYDNDLNNLVGSIAYTDNLIKRLADVNVSDISLPTGISTVVMYFNADMSNKNLKVIFNPNSGNYLIEFTIPAPTT